MFVGFFSIGDYMNNDQVYEDIQDINQLKKQMTDFLEEYNSTPGVVNMDLVLFRDAIEHGKLSRLHKNQMKINNIKRWCASQGKEVTTTLTNK